MMRQICVGELSRQGWASRKCWLQHQQPYVQHFPCTLMEKPGSSSLLLPKQSPPLINAQMHINTWDRISGKAHSKAWLLLSGENPWVKKGHLQSGPCYFNTFTTPRFVIEAYQKIICRNNIHHCCLGNNLRTKTLESGSIHTFLENLLWTSQVTLWDKCQRTLSAYEKNINWTAVVSSGASRGCRGVVSSGASRGIDTKREKRKRKTGWDLLKGTLSYTQHQVLQLKAALGQIYWDNYIGLGEKSQTRLGNYLPFICLG